MPMYVYKCEDCDFVQESIRPINNRDDPTTCACKGSMIRQLTAPTMHTWNQWRTFPNLTKEGDGTMKFDTKEDYNVHLKENHLQEAGLNAPNINKLSHKKIMSFK